MLPLPAGISRNSFANKIYCIFLYLGHFFFLFLFLFLILQKYNYILIPGMFTGYLINRNRWSGNQSINIFYWYQSKKISWYQLVSVNQWSINNHTKTVHGLLSIFTATSNRHHAYYLSNHLPCLGSPRDKIGKTVLTQSSQAKNIPLARVLRLPTCPSLPFHVMMSTQEDWEEGLLNISCIIKGYHLCRFEVNVSEVFTANQKRRRTQRCV